jgi:LPXTG-site transpeptidase (sortase) family protein
VTVSAEVSDGTPQPTTTESQSSARASGTSSTKPDRSDGLDGPYTLHIPRIGVNARVVSIRTDEQRVLNPPEDPSLAGWWSDGAAPGAAQGSAVLVGHTVRRGGGVFDSVGDLDRGDAIEVKGSDSALSYRVRSVEVLDKDEVARRAEEIFAQSGAGRLVIITCDDWDGNAWQSNIITVAAPA